MNREGSILAGIHDNDMDIRRKSSDKLDLNMEQGSHSQNVSHANASQSNISSSGETNANGVLKIGTEFESDEHAYKFYNKYATLLGFSVRKDWVNRSKIHGQVVSRKYTCSREGYRRKDKRDVNVKKHRKETRTGCMAHMIITRQPDGKYRVTHFEAHHNHDSIDPLNPQTSSLQGDLSVAGVDLPFVSKTRSNVEQMSGKFLVRESLDSLAMDDDIYLLSERRDAKKGEIGHLLHYFQRQHFENPSFFYAVQLDADDKVTNIFWSDDNMVRDYDSFGDMVCFDTIVRTDEDFQPFVQFLGVNHHNQVLIFAAALLFNDTVESLKWLFRTFLAAMSGKKPKFILTDQDAAVVEAINLVLPDTDHRTCVWQMCQNALKHLSHVVKDIESFATRFKSCIYDHKDEEGFIHAWESMLDDYSLQQNEWLRWMFREREKWSVIYEKNAFFLDVNRSHLGEMLSNNLKSYLNSDLGMLQFFKHFERVLDELRYGEKEANDEMSTCSPRLMGNVVMLKHASVVYTPNAFEVFQLEYEKSLNVIVNQTNHKELMSEYKVSTFGQTREYTVTVNSSDDTIVCSCMKFEFIGFLCCHALKVLDHKNIKVVPSQYMLKRWTKDAKIGSITECSNFVGQEKPKLAAARRYKGLCRKIQILSARAAESPEAFEFASRKLNEAIEGVEKILISRPEDAQGITSSSEDANASESENAENFLDGNVVEHQGEDYITQGAKEIDGDLNNSHVLKNMDVKRSKRRAQNLQPRSSNTITSVSSSPPLYIPSLSPTRNHVMQGLFNFAADQVVHSIYEQPNLVMDQQSNTDIYQQQSFYSNQREPANQTTLLQEVPSLYHESVTNTPQLRQAMNLEIQDPHSPAYLPYNHR